MKKSFDDTEELLQIYDNVGKEETKACDIHMVVNEIFLSFDFESNVYACGNEVNVVC